jgi:RES domain
MGSAVCWKCVEDIYLSKRIREEGAQVKCTVCGMRRKGFTVERLGEVLDPVLREHIRPGREIPRIGQGDDDSIYYEQAGDPLSYWVQEVLGQYFDFEDEIVDAVVDTEFVDVADGEIPFYEDSADYESIPTSLHRYYEEWDFVLRELKHGRRFFNSSAQSLFDRLFRGVDGMKSFGKENGEEDVVWVFPRGFTLYRARTCDSWSRLNDFHSHPYENVGPPPPDQARAGRMNVEGVVVFYGARDAETCLAEMRPALGGDTAVIELQTTRPLRMLDFTRLQRSHGTGLSYFQPDFVEEVERLAFLRRLHTLISQPVVPGRESDYLITQTLAEYLAHVHREPFDGVLFKSVQRAGGTNVVLFAERPRAAAAPGNSTFPVSYIDRSLRLFSTEKIQYEHRERRLTERGGKVYRAYEDEDDYLLDDGRLE